MRPINVWLCVDSVRLDGPYLAQGKVHASGLADVVFGGMLFTLVSPIEDERCPGEIRWAWPCLDRFNRPAVL